MEAVTNNTTATNNTTIAAKNNKRAISRKKLLEDKELGELLWFWWEVSPNSLQQEFLKVGVELNSDADIEALINLYNTGNDKRGVVVTNSGRVLVFDTRNVVNRMNLPLSDLNTNGSNVNWVD